MKHLLLPVWLVFAMAAFAAEEPHKLAFERGDAVWVAKLDGTGAKKIAGGQSPDLSPDGTRLAFNTVQATGQPAHRQIAVAELATGKTAIFEKIPSENCLGPVWSPDGSKLLFYLYVKNEMQIGLVNADGGGFRFVQASEPEHRNYWSATWGPSGESIFAEDMESLYQLSLEAKVLHKWKISKLVARGDLSGDTRMHLSADGKTLLMDFDMAEEAKRKDWDGPLPAIWTLDLASGKTTRITPKTLFGWDAHWLTPDTMLFLSQAAGEKEPSVYRMSLNGKDRQLLVKNARLPSSAP